MMKKEKKKKRKGGRKVGLLYWARRLALVCIGLGSEEFSSCGEGGLGQGGFGWSGGRWQNVTVACIAEGNHM